MMTSKTKLRRQLQQARLDLSPQERSAKSTAISQRLLKAFDWQTAANIHCFEPIERLGEVDISRFIKYLQVEHPHSRLFTTRQFDNQWKTFSLGDTDHSTPVHFDVIIVPMLGFDASLQRIGYGGGFYDHLLATQSGAKKIGVCFELGKLNHLPVERHDVPLDTIITESKQYTRQSSTS